VVVKSKDKCKKESNKASSNKVSKDKEKTAKKLLNKVLEKDKLKKPTKDSLEDKLKDKKKSKDAEDLISELSSDNWDEETVLAAQNFYSSNNLMYGDDQSYLGTHLGDGFYELGDGDVDEYASTSETMDDREAEAAVNTVVKESVLGAVSYDDLSMRDRERFKNWQQFNKPLLMLYDGLQIMRTSNTDYGSTM